MKGKGKRPSAFGRKSKGKEKPPSKDSMQAQVPRKLSEKELYVQAKRLVTKIEMLKGFESRKRSMTRELNEDIKTTRKEVDDISAQLATGIEMIPQGDLFADETGAGKEAPAKDQAAGTLAELAKRTSPAAEFVTSLGERNGMGEAEMRKLLWKFCASRGIRGEDAREAVWLGVLDLTQKPHEHAPASDGPQATA